MSINTLAVMAKEGRRMGCQMMVEGPGHVPLD
jgi:thiamine biosynthesis protein ThiC